MYFIILINGEEIPNGWEFAHREEAEQYSGYLQSRGYVTEVKAVQY